VFGGFLGKNNLKVSVAMCTYNGEQFVEEQLKSIIYQTCPPDEIVICDDGSADETVRIIQSIADNTTIPINIIENKENLGVTTNFEQSIFKTTGDIIFLSDQDDVWFEDKIESMIDCFINNKNIVMVYHDAEVVDDKLTSLGYSIFDDRTYLRLGQKRNIENIIVNVGTKGSTIAFKSCMKKIVLPFEASNLWSHDYWISTIAHAIGEVKPISRSLMCYRIHENNVSGATRNPNHNTTMLDLLRRLKNAPHNTYTANRYEALNRKLLCLSKDSDLYSTKIHKFIEINSKYIGICEKRFQLQNMGALLRLVSSIKLLKKGVYHQYFNGYTTFLKDLVKP
jgi:glycosyltransferase involved in cell wall biosynthesis